ncbi:MAG: tRNA (adenosine(37)-N6)-dimethylallyltransferase MiaA, partial [Caulobacteraceae bacterium]
MEPRVWLIAGPTASGKSTLALRLAEAVGGEVVNADSMQIYADLRLLTARPSAADEARAPHHLYGVADAAETWSVGRWLAEARAVLQAIAGRGRTAVVVGGTGLYFRALTHGLADVPAIPEAVRTSARSDYDRLGEAEFRDALAARDPEAAARISPGDRQRLLRAFEVATATGVPLHAWQASTTPTLEEGSYRAMALEPPRAELYV